MAKNQSCCFITQHRVNTKPQSHKATKKGRLNNFSKAAFLCGFVPLCNKCVTSCFFGKFVGSDFGCGFAALRLCVSSRPANYAAKVASPSSPVAFPGPPPVRSEYGHHWPYWPR